MSGPGSVGVDGARLELGWSGPDGGPTAVLLHEGVGSVRMWKRFPDELAAAAGVRVLTYSRRGHGSSDPLDRPRPADFFDHEARVVLPELLDRLDLRDVVLVGHSDGGSIALLYAADRRPCAGVVAMAAHAFVEARTLDGVRAAVEAFERGDLESRLARYHRDPGHTFRAWADVWRSPAFQALDLAPRLGSIEVPVLIVQGADDEYGTLDQVEALRVAIGARADAVILGGCTHALHLSRPDAVRDLVAGALRRWFGR